MITDKQREEFEKLAEQLIKWMAENVNPHVKILIDSTSAEMFQCELAIFTEKYLVD